MSILIRQARVPHLGVVDLRIAQSRFSDIATKLEKRDDDRIIDANGCLLYPGLVNTHHHLSQSLAKAVPAAINSDLNHWLAQVPFALWPKLNADLFYRCALLGFYELLRSGVTTCADHFYLYHREDCLDLQEALVEAAKTAGIRLVLCRGGATHRGSHRGARSSQFEPESLTQYLERSEDLVKRHHDASAESTFRVALAPTSLVHTSPAEHLKTIAHFARARQLRLHSHLLEVPYDEEVAQREHGMPAIEYAASVDWLGRDVWFAHLVHADAQAIKRLGDSGTGIAHCPTSNLRLGSGMVDLPAMHRAGMPISIGVDGSASSESASMFNELMLCWLLHRGQGDAEATHPDQVLDWGSRGGAALLGFEELGQIEVGQLADFSLIDLDQPRLWGLWEPCWAPVVCGEPLHIQSLFINGEPVLEDAQPKGFDIQALRYAIREDVKRLQAG